MLNVTIMIGITDAYSGNEGCETVNVITLYSVYK